jgi:polysaccharide export outer membrane protein
MVTVRCEGCGKEVGVRGLILGAGLAAAMLAVPAASAQEAQPYTLNAGDALSVSVWREDELRRDLVVLPDGTISFPLAGSVSVAGLRTDEVEQLLAQRLAKYIPDAVVSVSVTGASGYRVYVIGAVNNPGEFQVPRRITVMQALSLAGGLNAFAGEDSIRVLRHEGGKTTAIPFEYSEVKRGRALETDIELKSGDTVVVAGESLF